MAQTKRGFEYFSVYDVKGMESQYEKMAGKGWLIEKVGSAFPRYRKIQPQKLKFTVVYLEKSSDFALPSDEHNEFYEMCLRQGWYLVTKFDRLHVFANKSENPVPIETDGAIQLENLHKSKGRTIAISYALLAILQLVNVYQNIKRFYAWPATFFTGGMYFTTLMYLGMFFSWGAIAADYLLWYIPAKIKAKKDGTFYHKRTPLVTVVMLYGVLASVMLLMSKLYNIWFFAVLVSGVAVSLLIYNGIKKVVGTEKGNGIEWEIFAGIMVALAILAWSWIGIKLLDENGVSIMAKESRAVRTEVWESVHDYRYEKYVYADHIPLTLEDIADVDYDGYSYEGEAFADNPLISFYSASQTADRRSKMPELYYDIYDTDNTHLYDSIVQRNLKMKNSRPVQDTAWTADKVYQAVDGDTWLLCYPGRIVYINLTGTGRVDFALIEEKLINFEI